MLRANDRKAQMEIYNRYSRAMHNVAYRLVKDAHYAEDIMQEGFLRAFLKINDYRQEVTFGSWLKRIIINHSIDFIKKQNRMPQTDFENVSFKLEETGNPEPESDFTQMKANQVLDAIRGLKHNYSTILTLFYIEGYDYEEIGEILNLNYANCRTMLSRAKESLRKKLNEA